MEFIEGEAVSSPIESSVAIVLPAHNEAGPLSRILPRLRSAYPQAEIIVVDDGSTDDTRAVSLACGVTVVSHARRLGNGAAIKTGARSATKDWLLFMDADGQHEPEALADLMRAAQDGDSMVVGARSFRSQAGLHRAIANILYNWLAGWMVGQQVDDLTSGLRIVEAAKFRKFLHLLPNGFSYPTTITMCFFRAGFGVRYLPIHAPRRTGKSHISLWRDGIRFFLIIFRVGTLFSPLKIFLPISLVFFATGMLYYAYTYLETHRFTNMSALLLITSILVFLIGLVSEQITALHYKDTER